MAQPLVTLAEYKLYKKISKTEADPEIQFIIDSVNTLVRTFLGHSVIDFYTNPTVETFNIKEAQPSIQVNEWPIKEVIEIQTRKGYNVDYEVVDPASYFVDPTVDSIYVHDGFWNPGFGSVKVQYTAGFETVPPDLKIATLDLIHHYYKEEYKDKKQIGNSSIDNTNRYAALASEWPIHIIRVLDMYRNV